MLLDEIDINNTGVFSDKGNPINNVSQWAQVKTALGRLVWWWYDKEVAQNPEREIFTVRKWFISYTIRMKDLEPFIVFAFGHGN